MPTSVHIPKDLLAIVDRAAKARKISRNKAIVQSLEQTYRKDPQGWPAGFLERFEERRDPEIGDAIDDMMAAIQANRRSKRNPPSL